MVMIYAVANECDCSFNHVGDDWYFLSQGRTVQSETNNLVKLFKQTWDYFEYEVSDIDIMPIMQIQYSDKHIGEDDWRDVYAFDGYETINKKADIFEVDEDIYSAIQELTLS